MERLLRHDRAILIAALAVATLLCWLWIVPMARDMYGSMSGPSAWMMAGVWNWTRVLLLWAMWAVMMAGMMLPSASPMLLLYAGLMRKSPEGPRARLRVYSFAFGYLFVWALFSVAATIAQRALTSALVLTPMMELASPSAGGALLLVAGVYQLTPLKAACLSACQSPLAFMMRRWRNGHSGAFAMGIRHGADCLGCCWALMLLLFVGGVMNLWVIAALTIFVLLEKTVLPPAHAARISGALLIVSGLWMIAA
jgi:predicted metal-binding membrane protein